MTCYADAQQFIDKNCCIHSQIEQIFPLIKKCKLPFSLSGICFTYIEGVSYILQMFEKFTVLSNKNKYLEEIDYILGLWRPRIAIVTSYQPPESNLGFK